jgi:hypothetical protein
VKHKTERGDRGEPIGLLTGFGDEGERPDFREDRRASSTGRRRRCSGAESLMARRCSDGSLATGRGSPNAARCSATPGNDSITRQCFVATSSAVNRDDGQQHGCAQDGGALVDVQRRERVSGVQLIPVKLMVATACSGCASCRRIRASGRWSSARRLRSAQASEARAS